MISVTTAGQETATEASRETARVRFQGEEIASTLRAVILYEFGLPSVYCRPSIASRART